MDCYDNEYRRQYCQERAARAQEEYQRVQASPKNERQAVVRMQSVWERVRRRAAQRSPVYR